MYKQVIAMFMGEYNHTVDAKGRLIVPSKFREQLGDEFVITKGLDNCLFVYYNSEWAALEEKLRALPITNTAGRKFSRFLLGSAATCEVDKQGRILLPAVLRDFAGIDKDFSCIDFPAFFPSKSVIFISNVIFSIVSRRSERR